MCGVLNGPHFRDFSWKSTLPPEVAEVRNGVVVVVGVVFSFFLLSTKRENTPNAAAPTKNMVKSLAQNN